MKKNFLSLVFAIVTVLTLSGCYGAIGLVPIAVTSSKSLGLTGSASQTGGNATNSEAKKTSDKIVIYRIDRGGLGIILQVTVDGEYQGQLSTNAYIVANKPNKDSVKITIEAPTLMPTKEIEVKLKKGETKYVEVDTTSLVGVGAITASEVNEKDVPNRFRK